LKTLKLFTSSTMEWNLAKEFSPALDAEELSSKVSDFINTHYDRSRILAVRSVRKKIKNSLYPVIWPEQRISNSRIFENWSLLLSLITDFCDWDLNDKRRMVELIQLKQTGKERDHIVGMQKFPVFWKALKKITRS